jgi:hypothetical protein
MSSLRYACRTGPTAANNTPQTASRASATQKFAIRPISTSTTATDPVAASMTDVRRRNTRAMYDAEAPPRICAPATSPALTPAIAYESVLPYNSSR